MLSVALIASDPLYASWLADVLGEDCELHWLRPDDPEDPALVQLQRLEPPDAVLVEPNATLIRDVANAGVVSISPVARDECLVVGLADGRVCLWAPAARSL